MQAHEVTVLRESMGLNQSQLAARLGVSRMAVSKWERGVAQPTGLSLRALRDLALFEQEAPIAVKSA